MNNAALVDMDNTSSQGSHSASGYSAQVAQLSDQEFSLFQSFLYQGAGITLSSQKKPLVVSRLSKRLRHHNLDSYGDYLKLIEKDEHGAERQVALDLLTTNETYFYREPAHFEFLQDMLCARNNSGTFRVWSAACSSGQEPYSVAMLLANVLGNRNWEILASDISTRVLEQAKRGLYPIAQAEKIPQHYLKEFCLKGVDEHAGSFLFSRSVRERIKFCQINLNARLPDVGQFDVIFLRNVMIYFDNDTKRQVVERLSEVLKPGGHLIIGHSESLNGVTDVLNMRSPSIYQK